MDLLQTIGTTAKQVLQAAGEMLESLDDRRRVHLYGQSRAHQLDWDSVHHEITPADPSGTGTLSSRYGSLRRVFQAHRENHLREIFGIAGIDDVLSSGSGVARDAAQLRADLFRANQYALVETLNVTSSPRYQPGSGKTYCNVYASDFANALGAYLPRVWWTDAAWRKIEKGTRILTPAELKQLKKEGGSEVDVVVGVYNDTVGELSANALNHWMRTHGATFGWRQETDLSTAQAAANAGSIVVLLAAHREKGHSGHITVVLAESAAHQAQRDATGNVTQPLQSQAGSSNFKYGLRKSQWWADKDHKDGAAWLFEGWMRSPLVMARELGR